ncbi:hypothetical protein Rhe02_40820 [Rhizocola hellebori]|uniref:Uncharacterized protein n=1 Tax=Rhizocola hellebori TaxID=1392758 RepID=A0A8J3Q8T9_9ACTN|nr:hypothetical protein [Rhizocola hellebori]GIH06015.1 hypothetical protein Rhe02_40820 [Rhizocola hellebori]
MGRIVKKLSDDTSKYYWYPGEKVEWIRAVVALAIGGGLATLLMVITGNSLTAVVTGCSATLAVAGFNFGRRDAKALAGFPDMNDKAARRAAITYSGRAAWRGMVQGLGAALAAVLVLNVAHTGWMADWVMPLLPGAVGALGHQAGMIWDRLGTTVAVPKPAEAATDGN